MSDALLLVVPFVRLMSVMWLVEDTDFDSNRPVGFYFLLSLPDVIKTKKKKALAQIWLFNESTIWNIKVNKKINTNSINKWMQK